MKPFIKYRGGKSTEIRFFQSYFPKQFNTFIEPFVGGGAVFFHLEHRKSIINDINPKLMILYKQVKENYPLLRLQLDHLQELYESNQREYEELKKLSQTNYVENKNEKLYYDLRQIYNYPDDQWLEGAIYYFINKTAYSGMIRHNKKGEYNVPFGRYKHFNTNLLTDDHHRLLQQTEIYNTDYSDIFRMTNKDDFIFLDPPYDCTFNDYGNLDFENGFDADQHERLANEFKKLSCKTLMVIAKTDLITELYKDYIFDEYDKSYAVNIRNRFKNSAKHLIIKNFETETSYIRSKRLVFSI